MAVEWIPDAKRVNQYWFDPKDIVIKAELNGRYEAPDLTELKDSIEKHGQLEPVLVRNEGGKPVLLAGFSRWQAISELNKGREAEKRIRILATYVRCSEQDGFVLNWEENHRRNSTSDLDDAHYFAQLEKWGKSPDEISAMLGITKRYVESHLLLIELSPEVREALRAGKIKAPAASRLAKMTEAQQKQAAKEIASGKKVSVGAKNGNKTSVKKIVEYLKEHDGPGESSEVREFIKGVLEFIGK